MNRESISSLPLTGGFPGASGISILPRPEVRESKSRRDGRVLLVG